MQALDLSKILLPYENQWVALNKKETEVLGNGKTLKEAYEKAVKSGTKEPIMMRVLPFDKGYVPCFQNFDIKRFLFLLPLTCQKKYSKSKYNLRLRAGCK